MNNTKHIRICFWASQTAAFQEAMILAVRGVELTTHELEKMFSSLTACKVVLKRKSRLKEMTIEV